MPVKFNTPNTANARPTPPAAARPAANGNPFANIPDRKARDPMPETGSYRFKLVELERGFNPGTRKESMKVHLEIVEVFEQREGPPHGVGDRVIAVLMFTDPGLASVKDLIRCAAKIPTNADYNAFDPSGEFINACFGAANDYSARGDTVIGDLVDGTVLHGPDDEKGGYYRNYNWKIVQ
jgi:hypothetical protein